MMLCSGFYFYCGHAHLKLILVMLWGPLQAVRITSNYSTQLKNIEIVIAKHILKYVDSQRCRTGTSLNG